MLTQQSLAAGLNWNNQIDQWNESRGGVADPQPHHHHRQANQIMTSALGPQSVQGTAQQPQVVQGTAQPPNSSGIMYNPDPMDPASHDIRLGNPVTGIEHAAQGVWQGLKDVHHYAESHPSSWPGGNDPTFM